uniref:DDE-1 domain-containing protein n=1 Tax=Hyaloperonospora arabidopsidis (strain Emoy2) TaxID=559515 RepID=M4BHK5_HYAAE
MLRAINIYGESGSVEVEAMNKAQPDVKKNAIDCDERREGFNIYKVDQLTAMRWSVAAWNEISSTTIANCFSHTGLFFTDRSFQVQWRWKRVKMAQQRSRRKKVSWSKS